MAQPKASVITDKMRAEIGVESEPVTFEVDKTACRMFARAVGYTDPIYFDEGYAKSKGYRGITAPFGLLGHVVYKPNEPQRLGGYFRTDTPFKRVLNGGTDIEYLDTVCAGDVLSARMKISGFNERTGSMGPMLITASETTYTNQDGQMVAKMYGTFIQY